MNQHREEFISYREDQLVEFEKLVKKLRSRIKDISRKNKLEAREKNMASPEFSSSKLSSHLTLPPNMSVDEILLYIESNAEDKDKKVNILECIRRL